MINTSEDDVSHWRIPHGMLSIVISEDDAMGSSNRRGFMYCYLFKFAAKATHAQVSLGGADGEVYPTLSRWSYAIPLEVPDAAGFGSHSDSSCDTLRYYMRSDLCATAS